MKPYGVPIPIAPDVGDILLYGGSSKHHVRMKSKKKSMARRIWKRKARKISKDIIHEELKNYEE